VKKSTDNPWQMIGLIGTLGMEMVLMMLGGGWLGRMLDERWHTRPVLLITGVMLGLVLGIASAVYTIKALLRE
jgi:F0F1-type ATP synthase assembly protein I